MDTLVVNFAGLRSLASGIGSHIDEIELLLAELDQRIGGLTNDWGGAAAAGFQRTRADWFGAADDLRNRLAELRDLVVTAHDNHASAVRHNVGIWRV